MITKTSRTLAAGLLTMGLLAGCSDDAPKPGNGETSAPSESASGSNSPSNSSDDDIYPHGTPHSKLEQGRQKPDGSWVTPTHIVAKEGYRDSENVIRTYVKALPKKKTQAGVPDQLRQYVTDDYARTQADNTDLYADGRYTTQTSKIIGDVTPRSWSTKGVDTVVLDACMSVEAHLYNADGSERQNYDPQGNPVEAKQRYLVRYSLDSDDQGRSWRINHIEPIPGKPC